MSSKQRKITIAIADDHGLMRQGLTTMLKNAPEIEVVATVSGGEEAINLLNSITPDIFLMDIIMKGMSGVEATKWIKDMDPSVKVILVSSELSKEYITAGIKAGISGYVPKDAEREVLIEAIKIVANGESYFSPEVKSIVFQEFYATKKGTKKVSGGLTKRETEILKLIAQGLKLKDIADQLFISIKTVETHKLNIQSKLNLENTAQLVRYAIKNNLIDP